MVSSVRDPTPLRAKKPTQVRSRQDRLIDGSYLVFMSQMRLDFLRVADANQPPLCVEGPAVKAAHEVLGVALISATHPVAPVPAHVQENPYPAVRTDDLLISAFFQSVKIESRLPRPMASAWNE